MSVKLLTENHLDVLSLKGTAQARLSLHLSKCHIVGNHMSRLKSLQQNPSGHFNEMNGLIRYKKRRMLPYYLGLDFALGFSKNKVLCCRDRLTDW